MQENNKETSQNQENENKQEETTTLDGIAQLRKIGLKEVSNKTFINLDNLKALLDKDFAQLNRTKALGFIQILQREFGVDLQELKKEYLKFDNGYVKPKEHPQKIESRDRDEEKPKKFLLYLLLAIAAILAAYFFFSKDTNQTIIPPVDLNVVKNDVVTDQAKESLLAVDEDYEKEVNDSDEVDLNKVVQEMFQATEDNESNASEESNETALLDANDSALITPAKEENITIERSTLAKAVANKTPLTVVEKKEKLLVAKKVKQPVHNENRGGLFIEPIQKAWVGVIFLDTMKKKDFLIRRPLMLDASKDQIILVGHNKFKIYNKQLEQGFKSKKMVRFLYKDGDLREISKREYDRYRGNAKW